MSEKPELGPEFYSSESDWDETRIQNLLLFASASPLEKLNWLTQMLEFVTAIRSGESITRETSRTQTPGNSK